MEMFQRSANLFADNTGDVATILITLMVILRGTAEILGVIGKWTESQYSSQAVYYIGKVVDFIGWVLGLFGVGSPNSVSFGKRYKDNE